MICNLEWYLRILILFVHNKKSIELRKKSFKIFRFHGDLVRENENKYKMKRSSAIAVPNIDKIGSIILPY